MLEKVGVGLKTCFIGREIHYFESVTSTNDLAKELASRGVREGAMVIAEEQSGGRGRQGRRWISPEGGIWFSVVLQPKIRPREAFKLTFLTAVTVAKAIREMFRLNALIKWPNDILINDKKVCGILTEMNTRNNLIDFVVVGVGINANVNLTSFPEQLRSAVTSLREEVKMEVEREEFLQVLLGLLEQYYNMFVGGSFSSILEEWKALNCVLGANVEVVSLDETVKGRAVNVDRDGALIVRLGDETIRRFVVGDVSLRKFCYLSVTLPKGGRLEAI